MDDMKQRNTGMMRCGMCGNVQSRHLETCSQCGTDMALYGIAEKAANGRPDLKESKIRGGSGRTEKKERLVKRSFPKGVKIGLAVICVALLVAIGMLLPSGDAEGSQESCPAEVGDNINLQVPDFRAFHGGNLKEHKVEEFDTYYSYSYITEQDISKEFEEYRKLLTDKYLFKQITTSTVSNDWEYTYYWYQYTGADAVTNRTVTVDNSQGPVENINAWLVYVEHPESKTVYVYVGAVNELAYTDNGDRAGAGGMAPLTTTPAAAMPVSGSDMTVAGEADFSVYNQIPANALPDLVPWSNGAAIYEDEPAKKDIQYFDYEVDESVIEAYIAMLQKNGFTLVDTHVQEYKGSAFYSWGFTCDGAPNAQKIKLQYKETMCHMSLYYADKEGEYRMTVSNDLLVCDTGLRIDGSRVDLSPGGTSSAAGLIKLADGSYQTSDGRLTASVGTAMVLRDGVSYTTDAFYTQKDDMETLKIENYYRNEGIFFKTPAHSLVKGDVFTHRELRRWRWYDFKSMQDIDTYKWDTTVLLMPKDGKWQGATYNNSAYTSQTVRVMTYDAGGIAVFYIHSALTSGEPREIEALCVVDTSYKSGNIEDATYIKVGNTASLKYTHREFGSDYHTFEWSIVEGGDKVSIKPSVDSCDVTAISPGVASVKVVYNYTKEEPDVLTKIMRTVHHTKTQVYTFIVE